MAYTVETRRSRRRAYFARKRFEAHAEAMTRRKGPVVTIKLTPEEVAARIAA